MITFCEFMILKIIPGFYQLNIVRVMRNYYRVNFEGVIQVFRGSESNISIF